MPTSLAETGIRPRPDFERLRRVLMGQGQPDYVPLCELYVDLPIQTALVGKPVRDRVDTIEFYYRAGFDYVMAYPGINLKLGNMADNRQPFPITDWRSFESYDWPTIESISYSEFEAVIPRLPDGMAIIAQIDGIFEMTECLLGYPGLCLLLNDDRDLVRAVFERLGELYTSACSAMAAIPEVGAVVNSDDLGFRTQTLVSPADLREFVLPWHKLQTEIIHREGKPCLLHSCGNLDAVMPDLLDDVKIDARHSFEDAILPAADALRLYGDRIAIVGGFDVDRLCRGSEAEIRGHTDWLLSTCGPSGRYAFGTGNSVPHYVPLPHYLTLLQQWWRNKSQVG